MTGAVRHRGAYARGASRERQVRDQLRSEGWVVFRCAASKPCDLIALREQTQQDGPEAYGFAEARLIEVKADLSGPYENFRPKDRAELRATAEAAGAEAWLVHWPPRGEQRWIPASEWPA